MFLIESVIKLLETPIRRRGHHLASQFQLVAGSPSAACQHGEGAVPCSCDGLSKGPPRCASPAPRFIKGLRDAPLPLYW